MKKRTFLLSGIIGIILIIVTAGLAIAQEAVPPEIIITGYHVNINGQATGPYDADGLKNLISQGQLTTSSMVWKEGMSNWVVAGTVPELAPLFTGAPPPITSQPPEVPVIQQIIIQQPSQSGYQNFTTQQRWGTFFLNTLIPGLGSFVIMGDTGGGILNMLLGAGGYFFIIGAASAVSPGWPKTIYDGSGYPIGVEMVDAYDATDIFVVGAVFFLGQVIHNIYRSSTYNRPNPSGISLIDSNAWDLTVLPGKNGIKSLGLSYSLRF